MVGTLVGARTAARDLVGKAAAKAALRGAVGSVPVSWGINVAYAYALYIPQAIAYKQAHERQINSCYSLWKK
jgi:hypothetical protein